MPSTYLSQRQTSGFKVLKAQRVYRTNKLVIEQALGGAQKLPQQGSVAQRLQVPKIYGTLVPETVKGMVSGTRDLKYWVLGHSGLGITGTSSGGSFKGISEASGFEGP